MTRWLTVSILALGVILMFSGTASAQFTQDFELNFFGAFSAHTKNGFEVGFPQSVTPIRGEFKLNRKARGGIRGNVFNRGHWGQEFYYSYERNEARILRQTAPPAEVALPIQIHNFGVNALFYFVEEEERRVRPFVSFGFGAIVYRPTPEALNMARDPFRANLPDFEQSNEFAFNYGLGMKTRLTSRFGLRFDVRHFLSRNPSFSIPRRSDDPNQTVLPAEGAIHNVEASAGIVLYLGRR